MANRQLNDLAVTIAGKLRGLFAWPTVVCGMNSSTPVPLKASSDGTLATSGGSGGGTVAIDQTTPGTTNGVVVNSSALPTGAATAALQPALGTAVAPSANVITVQRPAVTQVVSTALEASHVLKAAAGQLVEFSAFSSAAGFLLLMNSTTVPGDGAVTLLYPPIPISAGQLVVLDLPAPLVASTGIAACISSTGSFTKTLAGSTCCFYAQVN